MSCIVFKTEGHIDLRAFTLMGVSAKPNTRNPIGYFGTGLKYAMAALVRLGCEPILWVGRDQYIFCQSKIQFRDKDFNMLRMRAKQRSWRNWRTIELPYSTEYGKNWQAWMIFRELEANTRDEHGSTIELQSSAAIVTGQEGYTLIAVDLPDFIRAYHDRNEIFLPDADNENHNTVQIIDRPSEYLYWRGLRVYKPAKPTLMTYNFLSHLDLTEDRTLMHEYFAKAVLAEFVLQTDSDMAVEKIVTATEKYWEHDLEFPSYLTPGPAFKRIMERMPSRVGSTAWRYYAAFDNRVTSENYFLTDHHPLPWIYHNAKITDARGAIVFFKPSGYVGKWELAAMNTCRIMNGHMPEQEEANKQ